MQIKKIKPAHISEGLMLELCSIKDGVRFQGLIDGGGSLVDAIANLSDILKPYLDVSWQKLDEYADYYHAVLEDNTVVAMKINEDEYGNDCTYSIGLDLTRFKKELSSEDVDTAKMLRALEQWQLSINNLLITFFPNVEIWFVDCVQILFLFAGGSSYISTPVIKRKLSL